MLDDILVPFSLLQVSLIHIYLQAREPNIIPIYLSKVKIYFMFCIIIDS